MKNLKISVLVFIFSAVLISGCMREYEYQTPTLEAPTAGADVTTTLYELKNFIYDGAATQTGLTLIDTAITVEGIVTASDSDGNLYKSFIIQDTTAAIKISVNAYELHARFPVGSHIKIQCEGLYIGVYSSLLQLGSISEDSLSVGRIEEPLVDKYIALSSEPYSIEIPKRKLSELNPLIDDYKVFRFDSLQIKNGQIGNNWADAELRIDGEVTMEDRDKNGINVTTSGYCDFAGQPVAQLSGSITLVYMGDYKSVKQGVIRNLNEVKFVQDRFGPVYEKDFQDQSITSPGGSAVEGLVIGDEAWQNYVVEGPYAWVTSDMGSSGNYYANMTNFSFTTYTNTASAIWMISPKFDLSKLEDPYLLFKNACNYNGDPLSVKISTDYDGTSDPTTATWESLSFTQSGGGFAWVSSGNVDLSAYSTAGTTTHIAFIYTGTNSSGKTWEIDDIGLYQPKDQLK